MNAPLQGHAASNRNTTVEPLLAVVILIGLLVENLVFDTFERLTVKRWGMQR